MFTRFSAQAYALLRIFAGLMFAMHGSQKLLHWPASAQAGGGGGSLPPLIMVGGVIELVGGLLVAIGFFAWFAAFICSGQMAVAYFMVHASKGFWPIQNAGESAVLYCFVFLYIAAHGSGIWSVDSARGAVVKAPRP